MSKQLTSENVRSAIEKHYDKGIPVEKWKGVWKDTKYCKYEIYLNSGERFEVIMTRSERNGILRSKFDRFFRTIGGLGYVEL